MKRMKKLTSSFDLDLTVLLSCEWSVFCQDAGRDRSLQVAGSGAFWNANPEIGAPRARLCNHG